MEKGESLGGELTAWTVKDAIFNQQRFNVIQAEKAAERNKQEAEKQAVIDAQKEEERQRVLAAERDAETRSKIDAAIRQQFAVTVAGYRFEPLFGRNGVEYAREWHFALDLSNHTKRAVAGFAGLVTIYDVFNKELGTYPVRVEEDIGPLSKKKILAIMPHNKNDAGHIQMTRSSSLRVQFFFESLAFSDGQNLDIGILDEPTHRQKASY